MTADTTSRAICTATSSAPTIDHGSYLGASDIGVIAGENHMARDESDVWGEKMGLLTFKPTLETDIGQAVERPIMELWAKRNGVTLEYPGTLIHPVEKWAGATVDAWIVEWQEPAEFKFIGAQMFNHWGPAHLGGAGAPSAVVCQNHWQAWLLDAHGYTPKRGRIILCMGTELREYVVDLDSALTGVLVDEGRAWWHRHVIGNVRPDGRRGRDLVNAIHPANVRKELDPMTDRVRGLAEAYLHAKDREKEATAAISGIGPMLCDIVADGSGYEGDGLKVTWKADKNGTRSLLVKRVKGSK